eukprot:284818867_1
MVPWQSTDGTRSCISKRSLHIFLIETCCKSATGSLRQVQFCTCTLMLLRRPLLVSRPWFCCRYLLRNEVRSSIKKRPSIFMHFDISSGTLWMRSPSKYSCPNYRNQLPTCRNPSGDYTVPTMPLIAVKSGRPLLFSVSIQSWLMEALSCEHWRNVLHPAFEMMRDGPVEKRRLCCLIVPVQQDPVHHHLNVTIDCRALEADAYLKRLLLQHPLQTRQHPTHLLLPCAAPARANLGSCRAASLLDYV